MDYTETILDNYVTSWGEVFVVLDSGEEYELHGTDSYTVDNDVVHVEGLRDDEWIMAEFPLDAIEHVYTHREV